MNSLSRSLHGAVALLACLIACFSSAALAQKSFLKNGEFLKTNEYLVADNKAFFAILQGDGNFCVYKGSNPGNNKGYAYCTGVAPGKGTYFAALQGDGNFCVYRGADPGHNQGYVACTYSTGGNGQYFAIIQGDGNFVVYRGTGPADNKGLQWDSIGASKGGGNSAGKFFAGVGDWIKGAANTVGDAFKGKLTGSASPDTIQVGGAAAKITVSGKPDVYMRASNTGTGMVSVTANDQGTYKDVSHTEYTYTAKGTKAGPVTMTFANGDSTVDVTINVLPAPPPTPGFVRIAAGKSFMTTNQYMREGDVLVADNKAFFAMMQGDGNFCVYRGSGPGDNKGNVYCLPGRGSPVGAYFAAVQEDGNFCVYSGSGPGDNKGILGCSNSARFKGAYFIAMQGDGNLVVYSGTGPGDNKGFVWQR